VRPKVVISRCIEYENVRWNAQIVRSEFVEALIPHVEAITICPEVGIGLGVPRETLRLVKTGSSVRLIQPTTGEDYTEKMFEFIGDFLSDLAEVDGYILKSRSPTSGLRGVKIYPSIGKVPHIERGSGIFGGIVKERFGHLALEDEGRLRNGKIREHFLRKLYTLARFREARSWGTFQSLLRFHTENKLLRARREKNMREMGLVPSTQVLSQKIFPANAFARDRLGLEQGSKILRLNRLRLANDVPMMLEIRYIRTDRCPGIEQHDLSSSLWKVFEETYGLKPYRHSQHLSITKITGNQSSLLGLGNDALVFLITGVTYLADGKPIECEESLYRSDKYDLAFEAFLE